MERAKKIDDAKVIVLHLMSKIDILELELRPLFIDQMQRAKIENSGFDASNQYKIGPLFCENEETIFQII